MADADMAEGVDHALMAEDAVGDGKLFDDFGQMIRHGILVLSCWQSAAVNSRRGKQIRKAGRTARAQAQNPERETPDPAPCGPAK